MYTHTHRFEFGKATKSTAKSGERPPPTLKGGSSFRIKQFPLAENYSVIKSSKSVYCAIAAGRFAILTLFIDEK